MKSNCVKNSYYLFLILSLAISFPSDAQTPRPLGTTQYTYKLSLLIDFKKPRKFSETTNSCFLLSSFRGMPISPSYRARVSLSFNVKTLLCAASSAAVMDICAVDTPRLVGHRRFGDAACWLPMCVPRALALAAAPRRFWMARPNLPEEVGPPIPPTRQRVCPPGLPALDRRLALVQHFDEVALWPRCIPASPLRAGLRPMTSR